MEKYLTLISFGPEGWGDDIAWGVVQTVILALVTLPFGLFLGFIIALAKQSAEPTLRAAGNIYTTIFRGLPELLTLFLIFFGGQIALQKVVGFISPGRANRSERFRGRRHRLRRGLLLLCQRGFPVGLPRHPARAI
jgi:polar amino acid transport system permease protein